MPTNSNILQLHIIVESWELNSTMISVFLSFVLYVTIEPVFAIRLNGADIVLINSNLNILNIVGVYTLAAYFSI